MFQRHAFQILHSDERMVAVFADFVDGANIGMIQGGSGTSLTTKSFERLRVSRQFIGQEFEGDEAAKLGVLGLVHDAHAAATQLFDDAVVGDGLADELGGCDHWLGILSGHKGQGQRRTRYHCGSPIRRSMFWKRGSEWRLSKNGSTLRNTMLADRSSTPLFS